MKKISRNTAVAAIVMIALSCLSCGNRNRNNGMQQIDSTLLSSEAEPEFDIITTEGTIRVRLYSKTPKHRDNFCRLVSTHFYDSLLFHRVIDGFMIQTGDPLTRDPDQADKYGTGEIDYTIPAEFVNEYYHKKGALAAARKGDIANPRKSSSGSQFYLVQDEMNCIHLDGEYTVFGETIDGMDVIDRIAAAPTDRTDRPLKDIRIIRIEKVTPQTEAADSTFAAQPTDSAVTQSADSTAKAPIPDIHVGTDNKFPDGSFQTSQTTRPIR